MYGRKISESSATASYCLVKREVDALCEAELIAAGISDLLARLYAARNVKSAGEVLGGLAHLIIADELKNCREAGRLLATAVQEGDGILVVADYDCDGATAGAVLVDSLRKAGANVGYMFPDRKVDGYGLSESLVAKIARLDPRPEYIVTVDNGINSHDGIRAAHLLGIKVIVTDHHHAPPVLPPADLIVNPNQPGCGFPSKAIAGCGVAWYVAATIASELRSRGVEPGFSPADLLPYVAIGTVADVVFLDQNNRRIVAAGLARIRAGQCTEGIKALCAVAGRPLAEITCQDIGFAIGPRINAAGRLEQMSAGMECLLSDDHAEAGALAAQLHRTNEERKEIQKNITAEVEEVIRSAMDQANDASLSRYGQVVYGEGWHQGVIGIVAGRIKETLNVPAFVLCNPGAGVLKGSGRSIEGFHIKHALDRISVEQPGVIVTHGGHAMAAGVSVAPGREREFAAAFTRVCAEEITEEMLEQRIQHDGSLEDVRVTLDDIKQLGSMVWGQGFPEPTFYDSFPVLFAKRMGKEGQHLKLKVAIGDLHIDLVAFGYGDLNVSRGETVLATYKFQVKTYDGREGVQLIAGSLAKAN